MTVSAKGWRSGLLALAIAGATLGVACGTGGTTEGTATAGASKAAGGSTAATTTGGKIAANIGKDDKADLTGAGATFPAPLYQAWFQDYTKIAPGVKTNYQEIGRAHV